MCQIIINKVKKSYNFLENEEKECNNFAVSEEKGRKLNSFSHKMSKKKLKRL